MCLSVADLGIPQRARRPEVPLLSGGRLNLQERWEPRAKLMQSGTIAHRLGYTVEKVRATDDHVGSPISCLETSGMSQMLLCGAEAEVKKTHNSLEC